MIRARPFLISKINAEKSIFKTVQNIQKVLNDYHNGRSIGFTKIASLKSMGLLPRKDGSYKLGEKYKVRDALKIITPKKLQ